MEKQQKFIELIEGLCRRPGMYTGGSVRETIAYIDGYRQGHSCPISGRNFDRYVSLSNRIPTNYVWGYCIINCTKDDADAFKLIEKTIVEYVQLKERFSEAEILEMAAKQAPEETEAEIAFRKLDSALLTGKQELIQPLIEAHKDAHVLWQGAYPIEVAGILEGMATVQRVKSIPLSSDGKKVKVIAPGWPFPIEMNCLDGRWIVNAEKIIELRKAQRKSSQAGK
ncbi:MAG: hypothetical protein ACFB10_11825 [Salibacteraceae bacterium]